MDKPQIIRDFERPAPADLAELGDLGVTTVHEAQGQAGLLDAAIRPLSESSVAFGPALTVRCAAGDSLMVHAAIEVAQAGDILVITTDRPTTDAYIDELLVTECRAHGIAAVIIDGAARDLTHIRDVGFPVWARAIHAQGTTREKAGWVNVPVKCGGVTISPGDAVIADSDGVVIIPREAIPQVVEAARARDAADKAARERYALGELSLDVLGLRQTLATLGLNGEPAG